MSCLSRLAMSKELSGCVLRFPLGPLLITDELSISRLLDSCDFNQ